MTLSYSKLFMKYLQDYPSTSVGLGNFGNEVHQ